MGAAYDSLALSSLPPAAVTVPSIQPNRVVFFVLLYSGLCGQTDIRLSMQKCHH